MNSDSPAMVPLRHPYLLFIEIVVLVVFRTLQGHLEGDAVLGDLVNPHSWGNLDRS
jgi:hypothetical protein